MELPLFESKLRMKSDRMKYQRLTKTTIPDLRNEQPKTFTFCDAVWEIVVDAVRAENTHFTQPFYSLTLSFLSILTDLQNLKIQGRISGMWHNDEIRSGTVRYIFIYFN